MLSCHAHLKVFLATAPCDLRARFNGLWAAAQERLGEDPKSGALFVFGNRRHNRIELLYCDGTGGACWPSVWRREPFTGPRVRANPTPSSGWPRRCCSYYSMGWT